MLRDKVRMFTVRYFVPFVWGVLVAHAWTRGGVVIGAIFTTAFLVIRYFEHKWMKEESLTKR